MPNYSKAWTKEKFSLTHMGKNMLPLLAVPRIRTAGQWQQLEGVLEVRG